MPGSKVPLSEEIKSEDGRIIATVATAGPRLSPAHPIPPAQSS